MSFGHPVQHLPKPEISQGSVHLVLNTSRDGDSTTFLDSGPMFDHCHGKQKNK